MKENRWKYERNCVVWNKMTMTSLESEGVVKLTIKTFRNHSINCNCCICRHMRHEPKSAETRRKISESQKGIGSRTHKPDCVCSFCKVKRGDAYPARHHPSKPQIELFILLKQTFPNAELEFPIKLENGRHIHADIGVPSSKIDFEYDGEYWHKDETKDNQRDIKLAKVGWLTFRINKKVLSELKNINIGQLIEKQYKECESYQI